MNAILRIAKHLFFGRRRLRRCFPERALEAIGHAIAASEAAHGGEICVAIEGSLDGGPLFRGQSARDRAIEVFSELHVWDTERNNGVLIYVLLADRDVEIVADRGYNGKVTPQEWEAVCRTMEADFREGLYEQAVLDGIEAATHLIARHFPPSAADRDDLPNRPVVL